MPYFKCDRCAIRMYSAASSTHCTECGVRLGSAEQLLEAIPLPRPLRHRYPVRMQAVPADTRSER